jgi:acetyl-CoA carboxylase carboxyl transferase subunit beta|tara:strand:+ start:8211 stop:9143 length:933 start_codon:yes stop_codon:yes gene_type:complete
MNWIKKVLNIGEKIKKVIRERPSKEDVEKSNWTTCCAGPILKTELQENQWVCKSCGKHHRISCKNRFDLFFGKDNYEIIDTPVPIDDPLNWHDSKPYTSRLKSARKATGQKCAVMIASGKVNGVTITAGAINFQFIGGSVGSAEGEAIIYGIQHAIDNQNPFVFFPSGGGQRMHESPIALTQMTRTTLAVNELKNKKLPYIICFTDPTAGGITASFASLGDVAISEPGALIAFAGRRVIEATVKEKLDENFQKAERVLECGFIDLIIERKDLSEKIATLLKILLKKNSVESAINIDETTENTRSISPIAS